MKKSLIILLSFIILTSSVLSNIAEAIAEFKENSEVAFAQPNYPVYAELSTGNLLLYVQRGVRSLFA